MKRIIYTLLATAILLSCQKADDNGELGGFWKLLQIEQTDDGSIIDTRDESRFWAVQLDLIQIDKSNGRFQHVGDSLYVQMIEIPDDAKMFGLYNPEDERFMVVELRERKMILRSRHAVLRFRKF